MLDELFEIIEQRKNAEPTDSYTKRLMNSGEDQIVRKISEEALEVILAVKGEGDQRLIEEAADLIYHLFVLLAFKNISLDQVKAELHQRHQRSP